MNFTGEGLAYSGMHNGDLSLLVDSINRYEQALPYCDMRTVVDIGCATGLGTFLASLVAKRVIGVDYRKRYLNHAEKLRYCCPHKFVKLDLDKETPPEADVALAFEVLEHLDYPDVLLKRIKAKTLLLSIPINGYTSMWHKWIYTSDIIRKQLEDAKWNIIKATPIIGRGVEGEFIICEKKE